MKTVISSGRVKPKKDVWTIISLSILFLFALFMIYPLVMLLRNSAVDPSGKLTFGYFERFLSRPYYAGTIANSFKVSISAAFLALVIGVPIAYFMNMYKIKGAKMLQIVIIMSSMSAPFIGAYSWILLLGRNGLISNFIKSLIGIKIPIQRNNACALLTAFPSRFPVCFRCAQEHR